MITFGLLCLVLCVAIAAAVLLLVRGATIRRVFVWISWIPTTALLLEYLFSDILAKTLSYAAIAIPLLTCTASLILTLVGVMLIASRRQHGERHVDLIWATALASVPGVLLAGYLVVETASSLIHGGI